MSRAWLACLFALLLGAAASADEPLCVAILPPDAGRADEFPNVQDPGAWLDTLLAADSAERSDLIVVDRSLMDRVLDERKIDLAGLGEQHDRRLKAFRAAGVLVCTRVAPAKGPSPAGEVKADVTVEAVVAQTGQLVGQLRLVAVCRDGRWDAPTDWARQLDGFWAAVRQQTARHIRCVLVDVAAGRLTSPIPRLRWMLDELNDNLRARLSLVDGVLLLVPRQALSTKEERLLRVMGLAAAGGDKAAALAPSPDFRFELELVEQVADRVEHDRTPIQVKVICTHAGQKVGSPVFDATIGQWQKARDAAATWSIQQVRLPGGRVPASQPGEEIAARLALEELAAAEKGGADRLFHIMRACHLDPTSEKAAWMLAKNMRWAYDGEDRSATLVCNERVIHAGLDYMSRFAKAPADHRRDVHYEIGIAAMRAADIVDTREKLHVYHVGSLPPRAEQVFPYARLAVEHLLLGSLLDGSDSNANSAAMRFMLDVVPNCPPDRLDAERTFWRAFWARNIEPKKSRALPPWELAEVAFAAARRDIKATKEALNRLAAVRPRDDRVWKLYSHSVVKLYLEAAGDRQGAATWQPEFGDDGAIEVTRDEHARFTSQLQRPVLPIWDYEKAAELPALRLRLPADFELHAQSNYTCPYPRVQAIAVAEGDLWLVTPAMWNLGSHDKPNRLAVTPVGPLLKAEGLEAVAAVTPVDWPAQPADAKDSFGPIVHCAHVTRDGGHDTVWLGAWGLGLIRFDKQDGKWVGRTYSTRDGLPIPCVDQIVSTRAGGKLRLLLGSDRSQCVLAMLDVTSGKFSILHRQAGERRELAASQPDGRQALVSVFTDELYPDFDIASASFRALAQSRDGLELLTATRSADPKQPWRMWRYPAETYRLADIQEFSPTTLASARGALRLAGEKEDYVSHVDLLYGATDSRPPAVPLTAIAACVGVGDSLWIINRAKMGETVPEGGRCLSIYRPAPAGVRNWSESDAWLGPFVVPDLSGRPSGARAGAFIAILPEPAGRVWATTTGGVYLVRPEQLPTGGETGNAGAVMSTARWRADYAARLARADWRVQVKTHILAGRPGEALVVIADRRQAGKAVPQAAHLSEEATVLDLWEATAIAAGGRPGGKIEAAAILARVADDANASPVARLFARRRQAFCLYEARKWQEFLDAADILSRQFPPFVSGEYSPWPKMIDYARRQVTREGTATTQPGR